MSKFTNKLKALIPSKRRLIQLYSALLFNANLKGFVTGEIYKGPLKNICTPGLNCYSCPGASGACPLGSLQNALGNTKHRAPYYILGILLLYGILLGRFICGFLCPFGLIQELLHKIKTPKLKKSKITRIFSYLKYVILVFFVIIVPILYAIRQLPLPGFCKYICPAGTLEGALGLLSNKVNSGLLSMLGPLFTWKFVLMVSFILASVFVFRFFCRFFCPLGAIYGLFNKISVFGIKLERSKCTSCGLCHAKCKMDIRHVGDHECISCGECIDVCPTNAISWKGLKKPVLAPNEINGTPEEIELQKQDLEAQTKKLVKRNKLLKSIIAGAMAVLMALTLVYYNFIDKPTPPPEAGNKVGNLCYGDELEVFDQNGLTGEKFDPASNKGRITIINFWGTWCSGCVKELPDFDRIAKEYADTVTVVAVHTDVAFDTAADYVKQHYNDPENGLTSPIIFVKDYLDKNGYNDTYYTMLGGMGTYPMTVILDEDGVIIFSKTDSMEYEDLKEVVDAQLRK